MNQTLATEKTGRPIDDNVDDDGLLRFVVKRSNALTVVETRRLRFLDITNFIAPRFSYERYLKAYGCELTKGDFPYEWMDSLEKLRCTSLSPQEAFYSRLKGTGLTDEEYALCGRVWLEKNMHTFADFLACYKNLDVEPMLQAIQQQSVVYENKGIDMLKDGSPLPGLAVFWLFGESTLLGVRRGKAPVCTQGVELHREVCAHLPISLVDEGNRDLYSLVRANLVGGPSIVFHQYHEAGLTRLHSVEHGDTAKLVHSVLGVDANT